MSESNMTKRLQAQVAANRLRAENERLKERLDTARMKEIKLLNDLIELKERVRELEGGL